MEIGTLRNQFQDRQLTNKTFNDLKNGRFEPYFPSGDVADKFREIADNLGEDNPFIEAAPILRDMVSEMKQLSLDEPFSIDIDDFLIEDIVTPPLPESVTSAMPNNKTITQGQNILNQGMNAQANLTQNGLTQIENALLSEEEKQIRLRQRGIIS